MIGGMWYDKPANRSPLFLWHAWQANVALVGDRSAHPFRRLVAFLDMTVTIMLCSFVLLGVIIPAIFDIHIVIGYHQQFLAGILLYIIHARAGQVSWALWTHGWTGKSAPQAQRLSAKCVALLIVVAVVAIDAELARMYWQSLHR